MLCFKYYPTTDFNLNQFKQIKTRPYILDESVTHAGNAFYIWELKTTTRVVLTTGIDNMISI